MGCVRSVSPKPTKTRMRPMVVVEHIVELTPPERPVSKPEAAPPVPEVVPPAPPKATPAKRRVRRLASVKKAPAPEAPPDALPAPAQASAVVTAKPKAAAEPIDFTGFAIVTGKAAVYAGGTTANHGKNKEAVRSKAVDLDAEAGNTRGNDGRETYRDLSRPVSLPARNWKCPWPKEAEALSIDRQEVLLQATITQEGRAEFVDILADPGNGFGVIAKRCALSARFEPARDSRGNPYPCTSPPLRVLFTR